NHRLLDLLSRNLFLAGGEARVLAPRRVDHVAREEQDALALLRRGPFVALRLADDLEHFREVAAEHAQGFVERELLADGVAREVGRAGQRVAVGGGDARRPLRRYET